MFPVDYPGKIENVKSFGKMVVSIYGEISRQNHFCHGEVKWKSDVGMKRPAWSKRWGRFYFPEKLTQNSIWNRFQ